jgi:hypothetical protein
MANPNGVSNQIILNKEVRFQLSISASISSINFIEILAIAFQSTGQ